MKFRPLTFCLSLIMSFSCYAQQDFYQLVRAQLGVVDYFEPGNTAFFEQALKEEGLLKAVLATSDRIVRNSQIGAAQSPFLRADGKIYENIFGPIPEPLKQNSYDLEAFGNMGSRAAQQVSEPLPFGRDAAFVDYLLGNALASDAVYYLFGSNFAPSDSLDFYKGLSLYTANSLEQAVEYFDRVPENSGLFEKSLFFSTVCDAYLGRFQQARSRLQAYKGTKQELCAYELAAISLLEDDSASYRQAAANFSYSSYALADGEKLLDNIYHSRYESKKKSPLLAAVASALVPGLGKIYSKCYGEGFASFLSIASTAAIAADNWIKRGPQDWRSILFTSLSALLYVGNIYGSYISVGLYNNYLDNAQNNTIVFNIHIPVRSLFP